MNQLQFDFGRTQRTEAALRDLDQQLKTLGLLSHERRILGHLWRHGQFYNNSSGLVVSVAALSKAVGFSRSWTREGRDNLIAFGLMQEADQGPGKPKAYVVSWTAIKTASPVREFNQADVFSFFPEFNQVPSDVTSTSPVPSAVGGTVTTPVGTTETPPLGCALGSVVSSSEQNVNPPHNSSTHSLSTEGPPPASARPTGSGGGWGFDVRDADLQTWEGRTRLWTRARVINPSLENTHTDRRGFIAAVLCSIDKAEKPPAMLLNFVRRAGWRKRGYGGIDGHWLSRADEALRNRERELRELGELV